MRAKFITTISISFLAVVFFVLSRTNYMASPKSGITKPADNYYVDIKNSDGLLFSCLLDSSRNPVPNIDVKCKAKFFYPNNVVTEVELLPFENEGFICLNAPKHYSSGRIFFEAKGKEITLRFGSLFSIAKK